MHSVTRLTRQDWLALRKPRKADRYGSRARKTIFNGHKHDSRFEADYAALLAARQRAGEIVSWEPHKRIELTVDGKHVAWYKIDFVAIHPGGLVEYIEIKGAPFKTAEWRLKWRLMEIQLDGLIRRGLAKLTLVEQGRGKWAGWRGRRS